ncbi:MAG TPA: DUF302 domain-containing protein [Victivallales bacterium]|nr:DUF302 domain-containing protein [Victivallales bacterium]HPO90736.1 DUF302 domain-containing protein [Victivallales bacterium]HRR05960.1 DUF302 domain-containing protein [Victivallales bacterium]HRR28139.1 DUF302 domain-containing protein [Victivallales bacterium]HRU00162.1 DUF302 domain-containing protein [Victivallales bacterium]
MKNKLNIRVLGIFIAGILWGVVFSYFLLGILIKKTIILEYETKFDNVNEATEEIVKKCALTREWIPKVSACSLPQPSDNSKISVITLCNAKIAKSIVDDYSSRKLASIIPCQFAVYTNKDGKIIISRLNFRLVGWLLGGNSTQMAEKAVREQKEILRDILK